MKIKLERRHMYGNSNFKNSFSIRKEKTENKVNNQESDLKKISEPIKANIKIRPSSLKKETINNKHFSKIEFINKNRFVDNLGKNSEEEKRKKSQISKRYKNKIANIETQMVSQPNYALKTSKESFNLKKILDFKSTIYRIYGKKKNIGRAFMNWDLKKKGYIDKEDLMRMSQRLGIPLNEIESNLLISLADSNKDNKLNSKEFFQFISNNSILKLYENEILNSEGNEARIKKILEEKLVLLENDQKYSSLIKILHNNQKELNKLVNNRNVFKNKNFSIDERTFSDIMKELKYEDKFLGDSKLKFIFDRNKDKNDQINFFDFVNNVNKHKAFEECESYVKNVELNLYFKQDDKVQEENYVNPKSLTLNKVEELFKKIYKLRGRLGTKNIREENFREILENSQKELTHRNLKDIFKNFLKEQKVNFKDHEIDTLIQGFSYDDKKNYKINSILSNLFKNNIDDFMLQRNNRDPTNFNEEETKPQIEEISKKDFQQLCNKIDFSLFWDKTTNFNFYKKLDFNKDGLLSGKDIRDYLISKKITSEKEADIFLHKMNLKTHKVISFRELQNVLTENFSNKEKLCEVGDYCNILGLKSIDSRKYLENMEKDRAFFDNLKSQYRVLSQKENCKFTRLLIRG